MVKKTAKRKTAKTVRILLTCVGRRVELLRAFRQAGERLRIKLEIHGADASWTSPAIHLVDKPHIVPTIKSGKYIDGLLDVVRKNEIRLLIPLIDTELPHIAAARERFAELGCNALVSSSKVIEICRDKLATFSTLTAAGIDTPKTWPWAAIVESKRHRFPYYLKPRSGSAATGNFLIHNKDELKTFGNRVPDAIVQEFIDGVEYTLDVYTGFDGVPRCAVPRKRLEVRVGEVSKAIIEKRRDVMETGLRVTSALGECRGVVTVQCMLSEPRASARAVLTPQRGRISVIEVNPRFGGGAPLAIHAGADFPKWILQELLGRKPRIKPDGFRDDLAMLRYDDSVFLGHATRCLTSPLSKGGTKGG